MAGNVTESVAHLVSLAPGHSSAEKLIPAYTQALVALWGRRPQKAADLASALLVDDPDCKPRFAVYRLWIEALAEAGNKAGLKALTHHLFLRGQAEPKDQETYAALRGLVHFELDEFGAASLLARSMEQLTANTYALELVQLVETRLTTQREGAPALCRAEVPLADYFHWQTLARGLLLAQEEEALNLTLDFVKERFKDSPMPQLFEFHRCVDSGYYAGAALVAERLMELYPDCVDYLYFAAYALFEDGDYPSARKILQEALRQAKDGDAELVGLLGHCHAKLGDAEKAALHLRRAIQLLKDQGLPYSHVGLELAEVEGELSSQEKAPPPAELPREPRNWLIKLSPRRCHELLTSSESTVDRLLRPMGQKPRPGDYCFFASAGLPDAKGQAVWKVVAVYAVDSEPTWHPVQGYHTALKLVTRLASGVPVDIRITDDDSPLFDEEEHLDRAPFDRVAALHLAERFGVAPRGAHHRLPLAHPYRHGVFQIDADALDRIEQAVKSHRDEMIERRRHTQSRRPTA